MNGLTEIFIQVAYPDHQHIGRHRIHSPDRQAFLTLMQINANHQASLDIHNSQHAKLNRNLLNVHTLTR